MSKGEYTEEPREMKRIRIIVTSIVLVVLIVILCLILPKACSNNKKSNEQSNSNIESNSDVESNINSDSNSNIESNSNSNVTSNSNSNVVSNEVSNSNVTSNSNSNSNVVNTSIVGTWSCKSNSSAGQLVISSSAISLKFNNYSLNGKYSIYKKNIQVQNKKSGYKYNQYLLTNVTGVYNGENVNSSKKYILVIGLNDNHIHYVDSFSSSGIHYDCIKS